MYRAPPGLISTLPAVDSNVFAIKGGNRQLPLRLLQKAGVHLHQGLVIESVNKGTDGKWTLRGRDVQANGTEDIVQVRALPQKAGGTPTPVCHCSRLTHRTCMILTSRYI